MLDDAQLAVLVAAGDADAFAVVYDRHTPALTRFCRGILLSAQDAEDAAQSAMLAALRSLPERPVKLNLRAWLFRVAHNEAISLLRARRRHEQLDPDALQTADVADVVELRTRLHDLLSDLRSLTERRRGALVMRELCGLSYTEIAGALGGTERGAMQTVFEARSALVQCEEGRSLDCMAVQRVLSDGDRRRVRARPLRAHLRCCATCHEFERALTARPRELDALVPAAAGAARPAAATARIALLPPLADTT
jgi:RNA polymerase sigma factor (sigma-70 family)